MQAGFGVNAWADGNLTSCDLNVTFGNVRLRNSVLSCEKLLEAYGWEAPERRDSCRRVVDRLLAAEPAAGAG